MWLFGEYLQYNVAIKELHREADKDSVLLGWMSPTKEAMDGKNYEIYVLKDSDLKRRRFVVCKELFQAMLDDSNNRNMSIYEHISAWMTRDMKAPGPAVEAEQMAEIAAMQFLYPYADRIEDIKRLSKKEATYKQISAYYGIPQQYVEIYLSKSSMDTLQASHSLKIISAGEKA